MCPGATSFTREVLNQFQTAVNSFHPALKYPWEISDTLAFLDTNWYTKVSIEGNGLCTSVHNTPTDSHSYLYPFSPLSHVKNSIPYYHFLRRRRLCSEDSDISFKSEEICDFFDKRAYLCHQLDGQLMGSQHYKRLTRKIIIEFHSPSHFTLTTT